MKRDHFQLLKRMDPSIRLKATGNVFEFAAKLEVSKDSVYRLIECMKSDLEAPIVYNKHKKTFEYTADGCLNIGFNLKPLNEKDMNTITGGCNYKLSKNFSISQGLRNTNPIFGIVQYTNYPGFW